MSVEDTVYRDTWPKPAGRELSVSRLITARVSLSLPNSFYDMTSSHPIRHSETASANSNTIESDVNPFIICQRLYLRFEPRTRNQFVVTNE